MLVIRTRGYLSFVINHFYNPIGNKLESDSTNCERERISHKPFCPCNVCGVRFHQLVKKGSLLLGRNMGTVGRVQTLGNNWMQKEISTSFSGECQSVNAVVGSSSRSLITYWYWMSEWAWKLRGKQHVGEIPFGKPIRGGRSGLFSKFVGCGITICRDNKRQIHCSKTMCLAFEIRWAVLQLGMQELWLTSVAPESKAGWTGSRSSEAVRWWEQETGSRMCRRRSLICPAGEKGQVRRGQLGFPQRECDGGIQQSCDRSGNLGCGQEF